MHNRFIQILLINMLLNPKFFYFLTDVVDEGYSMLNAFIPKDIVMLADARLQDRRKWYCYVD